MLNSIRLFSIRIDFRFLCFFAFFFRSLCLLFQRNCKIHFRFNCEEEGVGRCYGRLCMSIFGGLVDGGSNKVEMQTKSQLD